MRSLFLLSLSLVAAASNATTMTVLGLSFGGGTANLNLSNVSGMPNNDYYAGPFDAKIDNQAAQRVFCADLLDETVFNSATPIAIQDTAVLGSGYQQAAELYNKYSLTVGNDVVKNAALQAAIWKSIFPTLNYTDGTSGASSLANSYLASTDLASFSNHASLFHAASGANQTMMGAAQAVPEPASMAALAVGGLGIGERRRRA